MSNRFTHQDIQELLGAFALDAVDDDERDVIDAHLAGCPRCRAEVEGFRETAALLAHSGERAPEGVWDRISEALDEAPPALDLGRIGAAKRRPRAIPVRIAAAAMAIAAAVTLFLGVAIGRNDNRNLERIEQLARDMEKGVVHNAAFAALSNPQAEKIELASADGKSMAKIVRLPDGTGYLVPTDNLGGPPAGRVYQLWAVRSDAKISLGVLGTADVAAFRMTGPVIAFAVTEEKAGGVAASDNQPLMVGYTQA
ncbi:MAG TPA: anti-sigma factor [Acidimicrobiia bacterium]|nr:anti-sigma factor [Acidimicrobiia bacterium]